MPMEAVVNWSPMSFFAHFMKELADNSTQYREQRNCIIHVLNKTSINKSSLIDTALSKNP